MHDELDVVAWLFVSGNLFSVQSKESSGDNFRHFDVEANKLPVLIFKVPGRICASCANKDFSPVHRLVEQAVPRRIKRECSKRFDSCSCGSEPGERGSASD